MIDPKQLRDYLIRPVLKYMEPAFGLGVSCPQAVNLLLGTAAHESLGGKYIVQVGGPAKGIYQIEPATEQSLWDNYLAYREDKASLVRSLASQRLGRGDLTWNLAYQTAMCRVKYWTADFDWPDDPNDIEALAKIWKKRYNTHLGAGTEEQFVKHWPLPR